MKRDACGFSLTFILNSECRKSKARLLLCLLSGSFGKLSQLSYIRTRSRTWPPLSLQYHFLLFS